MANEKRRFLYVTLDASSGQQRLRLGEMTPLWPRGVPRARQIGTLLTIAGSSGDPFESYQALVPSPGNRRMAAHYEQSSSSFTDQNIHLVDMREGAIEAFINEHRFSGLGRASWTSAVFEGYLAEQAALGVPPEDLALLDWRIVVEGGVPIPPPDIAWADDDTLMIAFRLRVELADPSGFELGEETFRFRLSSADGFAGFELWSGAIPHAPAPGALSILPPAHPKGVIHYRLQPVRFSGFGLPIWPLWTRYRAATMVAGRIK